MSNYSEEIDAEIEAEQLCIDALYQRLKNGEMDKLFEIYTEIAAKQQSIEAKRQRRENIGVSFLTSEPVPKNVIL